jgi:ubiquinone/menaquinone biosynthesis C-methylase UbiE
MLAPKDIPNSFAAWNQKWGAPFGRRNWLDNRVSNKLPVGVRGRLRGPFSLEANNTTRRFEYPWAFHAVRVQPGDRIIEIGGGLSGFQFVLAKTGCDVTNVDPGGKGSGALLPLEQKSIASLNYWFGTNVTFIKQRIENVRIEAESHDAIYSISVIEHLAQEEIESVIDSVFRILKQGGYFVITVDLFLNLFPFTSRIKNEWGQNVDLRWMTRLLPFKLVQGQAHELFGFPEFNPEYILRNLENYMIGSGYPSLAQCLVLQKPRVSDKEKR